MCIQPHHMSYEFCVKCLIFLRELSKQPTGTVVPSYRPWARVQLQEKSIIQAGPCISVFYVLFYFTCILRIMYYPSLAGTTCTALVASPRPGSPVPAKYIRSSDRSRSSLHVTVHIPASRFASRIATLHAYNVTL